MTETEKKILIIDPNDNERKVMAHYLKSMGYQVETGKGLTDAIRKITESSFACITMDVDLPEMKGFDAVSIFQNIDPKIKVIMTAKKNSMELESKVREQDIYYYFIKSFSKEELRLVINNALYQ